MGKCFRVGLSFGRQSAISGATCRRPCLVELAGLGKRGKLRGAAHFRQRVARLAAVGMKPRRIRRGGLHGREEADEGRIELMIVAGELVALGDIDQRIAPVEDAEVRVRREASDS